VKVCLALFFAGNMNDSSRKRLRPKTAQVPRAEKEKTGTVSQRQPVGVKQIVAVYYVVDKSENLILLTIINL